MKKCCFNRNQFYALNRFLAVIMFIQIIPASVYSQSTIQIPINANWQFRRSGDSVFMSATVPGCVHTDLLKNKSIEDPFFGVNEKNVQWIENEDWEYRTTFSVNRKLLKNEFIEMEFKGLDTYADVYLNDSLILQSDNMFIGNTIEVKQLLKKGKNTLDIYFHSPVKTGKDLMKKFPLTLPGDERVFTRKAQYQYGWDWGPRLVTSGITDEIILHAYDDVRIKHATFNYKENKSDMVSLQFYAAFDAKKRMDYTVELMESVSGKILYAVNYTDKFPTTESIHADFKIPARWQPYQLGDQPLYHFVLSVKKGNEILDQKIFTTGFSNIKLNQTKDAAGSSFYFTANGEKIFIKGANLIPLNSFPSSVTRKQYLDLLSEAKNMHINLLRVWGGGIYENDQLYDLCDSLGIMVWQDFMYACAIYPDDPEYMDEINYQTTRLKDHPCIAIFCGNNEIDEGWNNWGWQDAYHYSMQDSVMLSQINYNYFHQQIPETLFSGIGINQNYIPSSPAIGWGHAESLSQGDCHYWGVWWGMEPFSNYNKKIPRFMSEYGFQGMPAYNSFKQFIPENELMIGSPSVSEHQKHPTGYETIDAYMQRDFKIPASFEDYIYVSQLLQAEGMQTAIEAHRRNMPYCMGTVFWQLNDCWPVTSWSVIDYYGNRKAAYYRVQQKYEPVMISVINRNDTLQTWFVNDEDQNIAATVYYRLFTTDGKVIEENSLPVNLQANSSVLYSSLKTAYFLKGNAPAQTVLYISMKKGDELLAESFYNFTPPKNIQLQPAYFEKDFDPATNTITITSNVYAKGVYLYMDDQELKLSDNFFDLLPGSPKQISLQEIAPGQLLSKLKIKSLNNLYNQ